MTPLFLRLSNHLGMPPRYISRSIPLYSFCFPSHIYIFFYLISFRRVMYCLSADEMIPIKFRLLCGTCPLELGLLKSICPLVGRTGPCSLSPQRAFLNLVPPAFTFTTQIRLLTNAHRSLWSETKGDS